MVDPLIQSPFLPFLTLIRAAQVAFKADFSAIPSVLVEFVAATKNRWTALTHEDHSVIQCTLSCAGGWGWKPR